MQRVMVLVVDSFHPEVLQQCLQKGTTPAFAFLALHGNLSTAVSTFPTMTPTASATIATGKHCDEHHVPGFIWYDEQNSYYVNYGASPHAVFSLGPVKSFTDLFYSLNDIQLNKNIATIYEELTAIGVESACINFFIRRAGNVHEPNLHWLMKLFRLAGLQKRNISGPNMLIWGEIINSAGHSGLRLPRGIFNKLGVNDKYTSEMVRHLIRSKQLPDFSLVFFPDNDRYSHVYGPMNSQASIEAVDKGIGDILSAFGSWEQALRECHFIVIGDHAQSFVGKKNILRLDKILRKYRLSPRNFSFGRGSQLVVSANERMTAINILDENISKEEVITELSEHKDTGLVMWKDAEYYNVLSNGKKLTFNRGNCYNDLHGLMWDFSGDLTAIDAKIIDSQIEFTNYPDAFERIASALDYGTPNKLLLSAPLGYEYYMPGAPIHPGGGSHGSLHAEDSIVPVISAGLGETFSAVRTIDVKNYVINFYKKRLGLK